MNTHEEAVEESELELENENYTIFNDSGEQKEFDIELCGHKLIIEQDPSQQHRYFYTSTRTRIFAHKLTN